MPPNLIISPDSGGVKKDIHIDNIKSEIAARSLDSNIITCFSDGHMSEDKVGVGLVIYHSNRELLAESKGIGPKANIYDAEMYGLALAATCATTRATRLKATHIDIYCDNQAAIQSIARLDCHPAQYASQQFLDAVLPFLNCAQSQVRVTWVPGHKGIKGNERADLLAKGGANVPSTPLFEWTITWSRTSATQNATSTWTKVWNDHVTSRPDSGRFIPRPPSLKLHPIFNKTSLSRDVSSRLVQLLTGHGWYGEYRVKRFPDQSPQCSCGESIQEIIHTPFSCPSMEGQRHILRLKAVAKFIAESGIGRPRRSSGRCLTSSVPD
ncbi:hypothetical protein OPQ81_002496 [Rhizoctonia solani]|nr:hypothetical protein OPQ81_002496 [Rhizoctonia solani]